MIPSLQRLINEVAGLQLSSVQLQQAEAKLTALAQREGFSEAWPLLRAAAKDPQLAQTIAAHFTVGETFYYRGTTQLDFLQSTFFKPLQAQPPREVKVWSAGCSTGEEAYTLASLCEAALPAAQGWRISVLGTDINQEALDTARAGIYSDWSFRGVPEARRRADFTQAKEGWQVRPALRHSTNFRLHNLRQPAPWRNFDLVLCRNVLIYFNSEGIREVYRHLFAALRPGSLLLTAPTDPRPPADIGFEPVRPDLVGLWRRPALTPPKPAAPSLAAATTANSALQRAPLHSPPPPARITPPVSPSATSVQARPPTELEQARQLVYHAPSDPFAHFTLALALVRAAQQQRARSSVTQALLLLRQLPQDTSFPDGLSYRQLHERLLALQARLREAL